VGRRSGENTSEPSGRPSATGKLAAARRHRQPLPTNWRQIELELGDRSTLP